MAVVDIRKMRMLMHHGLVLVPVLVRIVGTPREVMLVPVMRVVDVAMTVGQRFMPMLVLMVFRKV